ncbi:SUN domain-containing protein 2-like [Coregonus clupeaformis]|uniref:SUN domain-containing protein 2-like n=1 Tax=Coregonus clupeaformis TaxID=59861 RepID=UPI001E1C4610|nr:SUN domain-containing protein 2-like [Coregonus clupeaformis]
MSRRSARLLNVGYYDQSSDDEISGSMVSYKESPVPRVFNKRKPRTGGHKGIQKPNQPIKVMAPTVRAVQRRQTFLSPTVAPSVAPVPLAPAASVALQPSMSSSSIGFTRIDSSGYCSDSEEPLRVKTRSNRRLSSGIGTRTSASASCSRSCFPTGLPSWFVIFLFLLPVLLTFLFVFPTVFPTMNLNLPMNRPTQPDSPPDLTSKATYGTSIMDSALEDKMDNIQREIEILKQKAHQHRGISQMVQRLNIDMRGVRSEMNNVRGKGNSVSIAVSTAGERLAQDAAEFGSKMADLQEEQSITTQRVRALEDTSDTLQQQVTTIQNQPPPAPTPENIHLTPDFKEAMEKWLRDQLAQDERWDMKRVIRIAVRPLADRLPDFALESQGGSIVTSRCSETYHTRSACVSFLGIPLWYPEETPRTVIQGQQVLPGKCWPFPGAQGTMTIALSHPIHVTHVSLEHLSTAVSPNGRIDSAPKDFAVYGMSTVSEEGTLLGMFTYDQAGDPLQTFKLPNPTAVYRYVELHVLSNWGHQDYTCVYRFRVHGKMASF